MDTKRREPWVFGEPYTSHIRKAISERYRILPYVYTLFFESSVNGMPVMRSMAHVFPQLEEAWAMDDQYMLGDALLVNPVTKKDASSWGVYLPPGEVWYDYETLQRVPEPGPGFAESRVHTIPVSLDKIPVFVRGGHIIMRRDRPRRSSIAAARDPYTMIIALDDNGRASGLFYTDDGVSYDNHKEGRYVLKRFEYFDGVLTSRDVDVVKELDGVVTLPPAAPLTRNPEAKLRIERIIITGLKDKVKFVDYFVGESSKVGTPVYFHEVEGSKGSGVVIRDPKILVGEKEWRLVLADKKGKTGRDEL